MLSRKVILGNVYRLPRETSTDHKTFIDEFSPILAQLEQSHSEVIIAGDFNINLLDIKTKDKVLAFYNSFTTTGFLPEITLPTRFSHRTGTLIDNFLCKLSDISLKSKSGILVDRFSDHQPYFMSINLRTVNIIPHKYITINKQTPIAIQNFKEELLSSNIKELLDVNLESNPNNNYDVLHDLICALKQKHFPNKKIKFNKYKHKGTPWITTGILKAIKFKNKIHLALRRTPHESPHYNTIETNLRNYNIILKKSIRLAIFFYYITNFQKAKGNLKKSWSAINEMLCKKRKKVNFPEFFKIDNTVVTGTTSIANKFNFFFTNIGPNLAKEICVPSRNNFKNYLLNKNDNNLTFKLIREDFVSKLIDDLDSKNSTGCDGLSNTLLKSIKLNLVKPITLIVNQMLTTGIFPDKLKRAKVIPLFKKGDKSIFSNYRPTSLLPSISKLFEKVIYQQLYKYFEDSNVFYESQYGFRKGHSTELASLELVNRLLSKMDKGEVPVAIFIDLSKAFDTLDHDILLYKLKCYGLTGNSINLLKGYLTNRQQYVHYDNTDSNFLKITTGVPQGSIFGPLLFLIYMNDIHKSSNLFHFILFADDTTLITKNAIYNTDSINAELAKLSIWFKVNKLSLNVSKSKFMVFRSARKQTPIPLIQIDNNVIECVENFNFLGLIINIEMEWSHRPHCPENITHHRRPNKIEKSYTLKYFNHALQLTVITTHKLFAHSLGTPAIQTNKLAKEMYSNYNKKQNVCPYWSTI